MNRTALTTIARFLLSGGINTAATFALYWLLLFWLSYPTAYATSFVAGIVLSYVLNTRFVFRTDFQLRKAILFPLVYLAAYFAGAVTLDFSVQQLGLPVSLAPLASICVTIPLTFVLTRLVLVNMRGKKEPPR